MGCGAEFALGNGFLDMSAIALLVAPGQLVGFLLLANSSALSSAPSQSDCLLTGIPTEVALLSHPLGEFVQSHKNTEFVCNIEKHDSGLKIIAKPSPEVDLSVDLRENGAGSWQVSKGSTRVVGVCELAK